MTDFEDLLQRVLNDDATPEEYADYLMMVQSGAYDEVLGDKIVETAIARRQNPKKEKITIDEIFLDMTARHPQLARRS